jgi:ubiquinone biosynthesis protein COQ9
MAISRDAIIDCALARAARSSWETLRLHEVAHELGITLNDVRRHFREKEDLVEAWFDRADDAMLALAATPGFEQASSAERVERLMLAWLEVLAPYRRVTGEMILNKLEPGHLHYQLGGLLRISRTVQWLREAAGRNAPLPWRALEETALTAIYLMTFLYWLRDDSVGSQRSREFLGRLLKGAEPLARMVPAQARTAGPSGSDR